MLKASWKKILFDPQLVLQSRYVRLVPLEKSHFEGLYALSQDPAIWRYNPTYYCTSKEQFTLYFDKALQHKSDQTRIPFTVIHRETGQLFGSSSIYAISEEHQHVSIGYTWYATNFQRSGANAHTKYVQFWFLFDILNAKRVEFNIDERNAKSRASVKRYGVTEEGILRRHMRIYDGTWRNTVVGSILQSEWPEKRAQCFQRVEEGNLRDTLEY